MFLSPFGRTIASRTFVLLISLSATCFAFASGLANILASNLSGVPDNARVMGCLTNVIRVCRTASTKIALQVAIFLHMS